jgi:pseudaminic acid biosynthesis-associated methylase
MTENKQTIRWSSKFGEKYTESNSWPVEEYNELFKVWHGRTRLDFNEKSIGSLDRNLKILEIGCNMGNQLGLLQKMGFKYLYGIELNEKVAEKASKRTKGINIKQGTVFDIPYDDQEFDMVFTSGVLIHIAPENIKKAISEINRCSKKYIWGYENYIEKGYEAVKPGYLWRTNFTKLYMEVNKNLKLENIEVFKWSKKNIDSNSFFSIFLLKK